MPKLMNQSIKVIPTKSWDESRFGKEIVSIDTCPAKPYILISSGNHLSIWNLFNKTIEQNTYFDDRIVAASLHPSGNHVLVGFSDNVMIANVLDGHIQVFHDIKIRKLVDCRFNSAGILYAAACWSSIEVFDFISGAKINSMKCNDASVGGLCWGPNGRLFVRQNCGSIHGYNAVAGETIGEFNVDHERILDVAVTSEGNVVATSSSNKIVVLNSDLKPLRDIVVGNGLKLTGSIAVSSDLAFVIARSRDGLSALEIITLEGQEQHHNAVIGTEINILEVSFDGKVLLTNEGLLVVKDNRRHNTSMITTISEQTEELVYEQCSDVLVSSSRIEDQIAAKSRLSDLEMMIALESKTTADALAAKVREIQDIHAQELRKARLGLVELKQEEEVARRAHIQAIEDAKFSFAKELRNEKKNHRDRLQRQVKIHYEKEETWEKEKAEFEDKKRQVLAQHCEELEEFRNDAREKLSKQQQVLHQLLHDKADVERESKEALHQMQQETEILVAKAKQKIASELSEQQELSSQLAQDNGILTRRLASTQSTIASQREKVVMMLEQLTKTEANLRLKEAEWKELDALSKLKNEDITSKEAAAARLEGINSDILKARTIEVDKIQELKVVWNGVLTNKMRRVKEEIENKQGVIDGQLQEVSSTKEQISDITKLILSEKAKRTKVESKISKHSSKISGYQLALRNCLDNIQNPDRLRQIIVNLSLGDLTATDQPILSPADIQRSNETTLKLLETKRQLEEKKAQEVAITKQHKEEKANAVVRNARLLNYKKGSLPQN